jgi:hypothetical protein
MVTEIGTILAVIGIMVAELGTMLVCFGLILLTLSTMLIRIGHMLLTSGVKPLSISTPRPSTNHTGAALLINTPYITINLE